MTDTTTTSSEAHDLRLISARQMVWDKDIWRWPARLYFHINLLKDMLEDASLEPSTRAEVEMLIRKLYVAGRKPPGEY